MYDRTFMTYLISFHFITDCTMIPVREQFPGIGGVWHLKKSHELPVKVHDFCLLCILAGEMLVCQQNPHPQQSPFDIIPDGAFPEIVFLGNLLIRIAMDEVQADEFLL